MPNLPDFHVGTAQTGDILPVAIFPTIFGIGNGLASVVIAK